MEEGRNNNGFFHRIFWVSLTAISSGWEELYSLCLMCCLASIYEIEMHLKCYVTIKALKRQQVQICILLYLSVL